MATITITIVDAPGQAVKVNTDARKPWPGAPLTPAQAIAMELLGTSFRRGASVVYTEPMDGVDIDRVQRGRPESDAVPLA